MALCTTHRHSTTAMPNAAWRQCGSCIFIAHAQPAGFRQLSSHSKSHFKKCQSNFVSLSNAPQVISHTHDSPPALYVRSLASCLYLLIALPACLPIASLLSRACRCAARVRCIFLPNNCHCHCDLRYHATIVTIAMHCPCCAAVFACCYA